LKTLTLIHKHFGNFDADLETFGKLRRSFGNIVKTLKMIQKHYLKKAEPPWIHHAFFDARSETNEADSETSEKLWRWFGNIVESLKLIQKQMKLIQKQPPPNDIKCFLMHYQNFVSKCQLCFQNYESFLLNCWCWCVQLNHGKCIFLETKKTMIFFKFSFKSLVFLTIFWSQMGVLL